MKKTAIFCLILGLMVHPSISEAQQKVYPHLQIFLASSEMGERTPFIAFWDDADQLGVVPFPVRLLELAGLNVLLDLSYLNPNEELPSSARLKITRREASSSQDREGPVVLNQTADLVAKRGASKMFPNRPFLVIGHRAPSEEVRRVGSIMREIQSRVLACDKEYRQELEAGLNSLKGTTAYDHVSQIIKSTFPPCPVQRP